MRKYSFTNNGKTWERITKKQARVAIPPFYITVWVAIIQKRDFYFTPKKRNILQIASRI